jgi:hypothetical protein
MSGAGLVSTITGTRVFYASGGQPSFQTTPAYGISGQSGTGNGGSGGPINTAYGSGAGGSGIVIIRYPSNCAPPTSTTGNPQINYADGYQIYTWTSSGTVTF